MKKYCVVFLCLILFLGCTTTKQAEQRVTETPKSGTEKKEPTAQLLIAQGHIDEAKELFASRADINYADENGNTALHAAAKVNDADLITFLVLKGIDTTLKNYDSETALHVAIDNNNFEAARNLAVIGGDIFSRDGNNVTALEKALAKGDAYYDIMITARNGEIRDTSGQSIVHYFIKTHNEKALAFCIKKNLPIDVKDEHGITPLALALQDAENDSSVKNAAELLKAGAQMIDGKYSYFEEAVLARNTSLRMADGQTPLHIAAALGHISIAKYLVANGASVTAQDISGSTPLHSAVRSGNTEIAAILLENGADANSLDSLGKTPLLLIIPQDKQEAMYALLLKHGADTSRKDMYSDTVLHIASIINAPVSTLGVLVDHKADCNARNKEGVTPLAAAVTMNMTEQISFYVQHGADINAADVKGSSPLTIALSQTMDTLKSLITSENVNSIDSHGNTPLHTAVLKNATLEKVSYIADLCKDIDARNSDGNSALYLAIQKNRRDIGALLINKNADIFSTNTKNYSPLRLALTMGGDVSDWIITSKTISAADGSGNTALHYAAEWELGTAVQTLIEKGADANAKNANGETPLLSAVKTNNTAIIDLLIKNGASINERDNLGSTALHIAVRWDSQTAASDLIQKGIEIDAQNTAGVTPLAEAALTGKRDMALMLINKGADPNSTDAEGRSILINAVRGQNAELVSLMLDSGANPGIQEMDGRNASHEAVLTENVAIINMIRNAGGNALSRDKNGATPFSLSLSKNEEVIRAVVGSNKQLSDSDGNTLMHIAVQNKARSEIITIMAEEGYPLDTRNAAGYTPLALAAKTEQNTTAGVLLSNGANPFAAFNKKNDCTVSIALQKKDPLLLDNIIKYAGTKSDIMGNTILHYAAKSADAETVSKLISEGLDRKVKNVSGETPYDTAVNWQRTDIAELLKI